MRIYTVLFTSMLLAGAVQAQVPPAGGSAGDQPPAASAPAATTPAAPHHARRTLAQRFEAANTTHDGKLTLAQARAGHMNAVARDFAQIDKDKHGYVTLEEVQTFQKERRAARRAARTPQSPAQQ
ncbi:MAG TPA: hypothetical protein VE650_10470 [Acetobacteraceae bacterium]|nr:hypothetical protein [Acetobacteraceae bacterium]